MAKLLSWKMPNGVMNTIVGHASNRDPLKPWELTSLLLQAASRSPANTVGG